MQDAMLARARNSIVREFLASDSTRLVFIDADTVFTFEDIRMLVETDRDVVAAEVSRKTASGATNVVKLPAPNGKIDGPWYEAAFAGTGFMSLSRKCLESMTKQYPEYNYRNAPNEPESCALFDTGVVSGQFVGEDLMFCLRWRKMGGRVWVHSGLDIGHIGTHDYRVMR
jgi:choline kinase